MRLCSVLCLLTLLFAEAANAQDFRLPGTEPSPFSQYRRRRSRNYDPQSGALLNRMGVPEWDNGEEFQEDVFTFVRAQFGSGYGSWDTDFPDSDLNFSYRLQQLTSIKVNPNPIVLPLTDPRLFDYPFVYFCEPGRGGGGGRWGGGGLEFTPEEAAAFRKYLDNGGFAMFDDFWGEYEWDNFHYEIKKVFPDRDYRDIPLEHPIFHCVFDLKERPQVPSIGIGVRGLGAGPNGTNISWERSDAREVHYRGYFVDNDRLMVIICHNTDLGDGWEEEGVDERYFHEYSEKKAYPMGVNIVFYAMTH